MITYIVKTQNVRCRSEKASRLNAKGQGAAFIRLRPILEVFTVATVNPVTK